MKQNSKKRIVPMLFALLVVLTLVSCCFLGSTFARYTSTGTGSASAEVAKWDIDFNGSNTENGETDIEIGKLSPDDAAWTEGLNRVHVIDNAQVAMAILNKSDVAADITVTIGAAPVFYGVDDSDIAGWSVTGISRGDSLPSYLEAYSTIQLQFAITNGSAPDRNTLWHNYGASVTQYDVATNGGVYVWVRAVWDTLDDLGQITSDAIDTWLGQNVTKVSCNLSYVAVQSSELPA